MSIQPFLRALGVAGLLAMVACTNASPEIDLKISEKADNSAPVISGSCSTAVNQDVAYSCTPSYYDADGDSLLWVTSASHTCSWLSVSSTTGVVTGSANDDQVGSCVVAFSATDGVESSNEITFSVNVTNVTPSLTIANTSLNEDANGVIRPDGAVEADEEDYGAYSINGTTASTPACAGVGVNIIHSTTGEVTFTPNTNYNGTCYISVRFDDGNGGTVDSEFSVTVNPVNDAPATPTTDCASTGTVYANYNCSTSSSDVDSGDTLLWSLDPSNTCTWALIGNTSGLVSGQPDDVESCSLVIKVSDGSASATTSVAVTSSLPLFDPGTGFDLSNTALTIASIPGSHKIYVGGTFTEYKGETGVYRLMRLNPDGTRDTSFLPPPINAVVRDIVVDASGNVYVAGGFTGTHQNLMRLTPDGTIDTSFSPPAPNSLVTKILLSGSTLYLGGNFTDLGGNIRNRIAAVNVSDGSLLSWYPAGGATAAVNTMVLTGSRLLVGGSFGTIGGQTRKGLADISTVDASVSTWNPNPSVSAVINALAINGSDLIVGGGFSSIGGQSRNNLAAVSLTTGAATIWAPNPNSTAIYSIALTDTRILIGGGFTNTSSATRIGFAQYESSDYSLVSAVSTASMDLDVKAILVQPTRVYLGGLFTNVNSSSRRGIVAIDPSTGANN